MQASPKLLEPVSAAKRAPASSASVGAGRLLGYETRARAALGRPKAMRYVVLAAVLAVASSLFSGIAADDHIHRLSLAGSTAIDGFQRAPHDLFRFAGPEVNHRLMEQGVFPWWADPSAQLAFFRPLTSLTHALDHALWPNSGFLMHLQSVAWFVFGLLGLAALYRRLVRPEWVAALALIFYALDDARAGPITWIANRNALVAIAFSVWALVFHHRFRAEGVRLGALLAPLALAAGLCAAEGAVATCAYLFAYALFMERGSFRVRVLTLVPYAGVVIAWRVLTRVLGYGTGGSGVYVDPIVEPLAFLAALAERLPVLLLGQLAGPWSEVWNASSLVLPGLEWGLIGLALLVMGITAWLVRPLWKKDERVRFWVVGTVLAAVPPCATFPADRLLSWVGIGAAAVVAIVLAGVLDAWREPSTSPWSARSVKFAALGIIVLHVVIGPAILPWRVTGIAAVRTMLERADGSVPRSADIAEQTFVYVNPPADPLASYIPIMRADAGAARPRTQRWLATGAGDVVIERLDEKSLRIESAAFLLSPSERMLRSPRRPFAVGDRVVLAGFEVEIRALTPDGRPAQAVARFDRTLEDPSLRFFQWIDAGYAPFKLPAVGERVVLPKVDFFKVAYGAD